MWYFFFPFPFYGFLSLSCYHFSLLCLSCVLNWSWRILLLRKRRRSVFGGPWTSQHHNVFYPFLEICILSSNNTMHMQCMPPKLTPSILFSHHVNMNINFSTWEKILLAQVKLRSSILSLNPFYSTSSILCQKDYTYVTVYKMIMWSTSP